MKFTSAGIAASLVLFASQTFAQEVCTDDAVHYTVRYVDDGKFDVTARFSQSSGAFDVFDAENAAGDGSTSDFIKNVVLVTEGGDQPLAYRGQGTWALEAGAASTPTTIRYTVEARHETYEWRNGKEEIAYRFDDAFYFVGAQFFVLNFDLFNCAPEISFELPVDWDVAAPWPRISPSTYRPENGDLMMFNGFAMGPNLQTLDATFGESGEVKFIFDKSLAPVARQAATDMNDVVKRYTEIFGGVADGDFMIFMTTDQGNDGGAFRNSFAQRFKAPVRESDGIVWRTTFAHETLHLWMGHTIRPADGDIEWFKEGFTDYITSKALYADGVYNTSDYSKKIENIIGRYMISLAFGGPKPLVEASNDKGANRLTVYGGGALMALILDAEMTAELGEGAFERMLADVFAGSGERYTQARLMATLDRNSNGRASKILAEIDAGLNPFVLSDRLNPHGLELSVFTPEEMYVSFNGAGCKSRKEPCPPAFLRLP